MFIGIQSRKNNMSHDGTKKHTATNIPIIINNRRMATAILNNTDKYIKLILYNACTVYLLVYYLC